MPSAARTPEERALPMLQFEPPSLRMSLPRTEQGLVDVARWRARLRSLDARSVIEPLRAFGRSLLVAGAGVLLGALAVLALSRPAPSPSSAPAIARTEPSAEAPCARQTWPYLDRRCMAEAREAAPPGRLVTTDHLARPPSPDARSAPPSLPSSEGRQHAAATDGTDSERTGVGPEARVAPAETRQLNVDEPPPERLEPPRRPRWTGFEFDGRGRSYGKRRGFRPFLRDDPMTRVY